MKLNTKKGGIELHADEKRTLHKALQIAIAIKKHGDGSQGNAADQIIKGVEAIASTLDQEAAQ